MLPPARTDDAVAMHRGTGATFPLPKRSRVDAASQIAVDHAVFTSLRSLQGEGYRIVAASPGVNAEERREITRRSPSHDSFDDPDRGLAILAYPLASGRHCVGLTRSAGVEHTGRGGPRVHTHAVILDGTHYRRFAANPVRVCRALVAAVGDDPWLDCAEKLEPLIVHAPPQPVAVPVTDLARLGTLAPSGLVWQLSRNLLKQAPAVVVAPEVTEALVEWALMTLPMARREQVSLSAGLRFAPGRELECTVLAAVDTAARRAVRGRGLEWLEAATLGGQEPSAYDGWLELLFSLWTTDRLAESRGLTGSMTDPVSAEDLDRAVTIFRDRDDAMTATLQDLVLLVEGYRQESVTADWERGLVDELVEIASCRIAQLREEESRA